MAQHNIYLNQQTTRYVQSQQQHGESIPVTAARLLRELAEREIVKSLKMTNTSGEPMIPQYERQ